MSATDKKSDVSDDIATIGAEYGLTREEIASLWITCGDLRSFVRACRDADRQQIRCPFCYGRLAR